MEILIGSWYGGNIKTEPQSVNAATCTTIAYHFRTGNGDHGQFMTRKQKTIRDLMLAGF